MAVASSPALPCPPLRADAKHKHLFVLSGEGKWQEPQDYPENLSGQWLTDALMWLVGGRAGWMAMIVRSIAQI